MNRSDTDSELRVRLAKVEEAPAVASLLRAAFAEFRAQYTPEAFAVTTPTAAQVRSRWGDGPVWVAEQTDRVVGTVGGVPGNEALYVRSMGLLPEVRGRGIGWMLLEQTESEAKIRGLGCLVLSTTPFLDRAIRLYELFGFVRTNDGPHELFGTPLFTMVKRLDHTRSITRPAP